MSTSTQSVRNQRHPKGSVTSISTNLLHLRNPWVTAFWAMMFPGFGHIILGSYVKDFILILWEFVINHQARINAAIMYSFTGRYELAKQVVDWQWLLLYIAVLTYSIWDSYRTTVSLNKYTILAERENSPMIPFKISTIEIDYFDKRIPWNAAIWSAIMPGLGHLYTHRLPTGFFILSWWISVVYFSHASEAVLYTGLGNFSQAVAITDPQWLRNLPSLMGFAVYDSYVNTVEYNRLFDTEQAKFLRDNYRDPTFVLPI